VRGERTSGGPGSRSGSWAREWPGLGPSWKRGLWSPRGAPDRPAEPAGPLTFMGSQTKRVLLSPLTHPARPFRVSNHDRSSRRGVMASSLQELISKTLDALVITTGLVTLVLEEDGTVVDTEEFFQTLGDNTHFMILEKGQKWMLVSKNTVTDCLLPPRGSPATQRVSSHPGGLLSLLRFLSYSAQVTGQFLVYMGTYMLRVLDDKEERPSLRSQVKGRFTCG
uniref:Lipid transferase CIDEA n=1 Tax=Mandrillus leucophaeus TaxID=9568 RepID=A0A2K6A3F1_MANLE